MLEIRLASNVFDDESLSDLQYALFRDLNAIEGVDVSHFEARPGQGERGALSAFGVALKSVAPGAITSVVEAFAARLSSTPDIDLDLNGIKLSTRNLDAEEFISILAQAIQKK